MYPDLGHTRSADYSSMLCLCDIVSQGLHYAFSIPCPWPQNQMASTMSEIPMLTKYPSIMPTDSGRERVPIVCDSRQHLSHVGRSCDDLPATTCHSRRNGVSYQSSTNQQREKPSMLPPPWGQCSFG